MTISISFPPAPDINDTPISLQEAVTAIVASIAFATTNNIKECIAIVDAGGHLIASAKMDGTILAGVYGSVGKARASLMFGQPSSALMTRMGAGPWEVPPTTSLAPLPVPTLPGVAQAWGDGQQPIYAQGAVPIKRGGLNGVVVGAIGCGGASSDKDEACAAAGAATIS